MDFVKAFEDVRNFHRAFGHPIGPEGAVRVMNEKELNRRVNWIEEELTEFEAAETLHDQADALTDANYFLLGNLVVLGSPIEPTLDLLLGAALQPKTALRPRLALKEERGLILETLRDMTTQMRRAKNDFYEQVILSNTMAYAVRATFSSIGIIPQPIWDIVHSANMAKLQPDGSVAYWPDGKVRKPDGWVAPEPLIEAEVQRQIDNARALAA